MHKYDKYENDPIFVCVCGGKICEPLELSINLKG